MSEFLAEARVLISPDTKAFRAELTKQLLTATRGIVVPVQVTPVAAKSVAAAAAATQGLATASAGAAQESLALAGAQQTLAASTTKSTAALLGAGTATARLDAALLALRTAVGSTAVIGLGALALAGIAAGKAFQASLKNFIQFQQQLSVFRATAGATADDMERVSEAATRLGDDVRLPGVSALDAATAMTELSKAGLSVQDSIAGAEGVLQLATAAQISNADAAQIAANALNAFGLAGDQATRVADDLANAANAAQGSISDFGQAFQQASAVARQVGLSLEDTTALLSLFAKNGLQGSDAGTSLRVALIKLVAPTKAAGEEIRKLGLNIRDAQGNVRADVFAQFGEATKNLAPAARDAAAALIFGQDAIRAVSIGAREGEKGLRLMQFQIDQTGTAAELAGARTVGLGGSFSALSSTASTLSLQFGKLISLGLKPYVDIAVVALGATNKLATALDNLATSALNADTPLGKVKDRLFDIASVGFPLIGEVRLIKAGLDALGVGTSANSEKIATLTKELQALQKARIAAEQGGQSSIADSLTKQINALRDEIKALKNDGKGITGDVTQPLQEAISELQKVRNIRIGEGLDTGPIDRLIKSLQDTIPIAQQTEGNINRLRDDFLELGAAGSKGAGGVDALTRALRQLGTQSAQTQAELLKLQTEGGSPQQQIAVLQSDIQTQRDIIDAAKRKGGPGSATAIKKAREQILRDQAQIDSLQTQIENDAKAAASEAKKKADDIAQAQEDATKAFISAFDPKKQKLLNQITNAGLTERLSDDIKFEKQLQAFLIAERKAIKDRIRRLKLHGDALKAAQAAIKAINQEIFQVTNEIAQDQAAQQKRTQDILNQKIDLRIRIAQARGDVAAEIKARKARLDRITAELVKLKNAGKKNTVAWLELKAQQVEEIAAIKELEGEAKKKDNAASSFFNFLQTTQGFAQNLLGNLIPGFATKGLVGGSAGGGATGTQDPFAFNPNAAEINTGVRATAQVSSAMGATVKPIQVDTTNSILRQILATLQGRHTRPPEIVHNRRTGSAAFDTL